MEGSIYEFEGNIYYSPSKQLKEKKYSKNLVNLNTINLVAGNNGYITYTVNQIKKEFKYINLEKCMKKINKYISKVDFRLSAKACRIVKILWYYNTKCINETEFYTALTNLDKVVFKNGKMYLKHNINMIGQRFEKGGIINEEDQKSIKKVASELKSSSKQLDDFMKSLSFEEIQKAQNQVIESYSMNSIDVTDENGQVIKQKTNKPNYSLLPMKQLEGVTRVLDFGAKKYAPNSWKKGNVVDYIDAAIRHLIELKEVELKDKETGERHTDHAICNLLFINYLLDKDPKQYENITR